MKRFIIIGLGNFGTAVAQSLYRMGHDVVAVDADQTVVDRIAPHVTRAAAGDGRQKDVLERVGARDAEVGIVATGDDITASVLATMSLRDLGVEHVYVKVVSHDHARVMRRLGAEETVFPEYDSAQNLAVRVVGETVLNYVRLGGGFSLQEMVVPNKWDGRTLRDLQLRTRHKISVVGVHDVLTDTMHVPPDPDAILKESDTLIVAGKHDALRRVADLD